MYLTNLLYLFLILYGLVWVLKMSQLLDIICNFQQFIQQLKGFLREIRNMVLQGSKEQGLYEFFQSNRNVIHGKDNSSHRNLQHLQLARILDEYRRQVRLSNLVSVPFHCQFVDPLRSIHQQRLLHQSLLEF